MLIAKLTSNPLLSTGLVFLHRPRLRLPARRWCRVTRSFASSVARTQLGVFDGWAQANENGFLLTGAGFMMPKVVGFTLWFYTPKANKLSLYIYICILILNTNWDRQYHDIMYGFAWFSDILTWFVFAWSRQLHARTHPEFDELLWRVEQQCAVQWHWKMASFCDTSDKSEVPKWGVSSHKFVSGQS